MTERIVKATVDNTLAGTDRFAGSISGMGAGAAAYLSKLPAMVSGGVRSASNLFHAETIGPNIKVLAGLASPLIAGLAIAGAGIGLVVAVGTGAVKGFTAHEADKPRQFTLNQAVGNSWNSVRGGTDATIASAVEDTRATRERKLAPGEDPWDIPLPPFGRTAQTAAATVAGIVVGGLGGLTTALVSTARGAWSGLKQIAGFQGAGESLAGLGTLVGAPVTATLDGVSKLFTTPVKAAAVAWKEKSLSKAVKAAVGEAFDSAPTTFSTAVGAGVGGLAVSLPSAAVTAVVTSAVELGRGAKATFTSPELNLPGKLLGTIGTVVTAPAAGLAHGLATAVTTPVKAAISGAHKKSLGDSVTEGVKGGYEESKGFAAPVGAFVGGLAVGAISGTAAAATGLVSEVGGGVVSALSNKDLNLPGKVLAGLGGVPGDLITAIGEGVGTVLMSPVRAGGEALTAKAASRGVVAAAGYGVRAIEAAANPARALVERG